MIKGARKITVTIQNRKYDAKVLHRNPKQDLAVIKVDGSGLPTVPLGDSTNLGLLEKVYAVGYPLSDVLGKSIKATEGSISGLVNEGTPLIQVGAGINPGNSGGPLFNGKGEVIGVCSSKLVGNDITNVGFAVPVNELKTFLQSKQVTSNAKPSTGLADPAAMMQRVVGGVAFVEVQLGLDSNNYQMLNFSGFTFESGAGSPLTNSTNGEMLMTSKGEVIAEKGDGMLPALIGSYSSMVVDKLPEDGETTWETGRFYTITIESRYVPQDPRRGFGAQRTQVLYSIVPVVETMSYRLGARQGDIQTIHRKHELIAAQEGKSAKLFASVGEGTVQFDVAKGFPISSVMNYTHVRAEGNTEVKLPIEFSYNLFKQQSEAEFQAEMAQKRK